MQRATGVTLGRPSRVALSAMVVLGMWAGVLAPVSAGADTTGDLGDITEVDRRFIDASLSGSAGDELAWGFQLAEPKAVGIGLRRLDADADLVLENLDGTELAASRAAGTANEWIRHTLPAGDYVVRAVAQEPGANDFKLRYGTDEPDDEPDLVRSESEELTDGGDSVQSGTVAWSSTLTVEATVDSAPAIHGYSLWSKTGSLSSSGSLSIGDERMRLLALLDISGGLFLVLSQQPETDFVLQVGDEEFAASQSKVPSVLGNGRFWWPTGGELLSSSVEVGLSIWVETDAAPLGERSPAPPTAYFGSLPVGHDGSSDVQMKLRFTEDVDVDAADLADDVVSVTGGQISSVEAEASDSTRNWIVTLAPDGDGDVTASLAGGLACTLASAVCTSDGRQLHNSVEARVSGPTPASSTEAGTVGLTDLVFEGLASLNFDPATTRYETSAPQGTASATVLATPDESDATVDIFVVHGSDASLSLDSVDTDANTAGHQIAIAASGDTLVLVLVTSADGLRQQMYTVFITSAPRSSPRADRRFDPGTLSSLARTSDELLRSSTLPALATLSLGTVAISPVFAPGTTIYTASADADVDSVTVSATAADTGSTTAITPSDSDANTAGHQVGLVAGEPGGPATQTVLAVIVRASDGTLNAYVVTVTRAAPPIADRTLSALAFSDVTLNPTFETEVFSYAANVTNRVSQVTVTAVATESADTVTISPSDADANKHGHQVELAVGVNPITVTVTSGSVSTVYTATVTRDLAVTDVTLETLLSPGCILEDLDLIDGTLQKTNRWRPRCESTLTYKEHHQDPDDTRTTGYARFYRFSVAAQTDVLIETNRGGAGTSHHFVIRDSNADIVEHRMWHGDTTWLVTVAWCERHYLLRCLPKSRFEVRLDAGSYVLELVQHYSHDDRRREHIIEISGTGVTSP